MDNIVNATMSGPGVAITTSLIVVIQISNQATAGGLLDRCHKLLRLVFHCYMLDYSDQIMLRLRVTSVLSIY